MWPFQQNLSISVGGIIVHSNPHLCPGRINPLVNDILKWNRSDTSRNIAISDATNGNAVPCKFRVHMYRGSMYNWLQALGRNPEAQRHEAHSLKMGNPAFFAYLCVSVCELVGHLCLYLCIATALPKPLSFKTWISISRIIRKQNVYSRLIEFSTARRCLCRAEHSGSLRSAFR